jgi:hypothetical protein
VTTDEHDNDLEELWILEPKSESLTFDLLDTPPPWKLPTHPHLSATAKRRRRRAKQSPFPRSEYLVGFRGWIVRDKHICPVAVGKAWPYCEPLHAEHVGSSGRRGSTDTLPHDAPHAGCMCGTWGFKDPRMAVGAFRPYARSFSVALGAVAMWGRVFEHRFGYRAEWTYPLTLELYGCTDDTAAVLEEAYGIPVKHIVRKPKQVEPLFDPNDPTSWKLGSGSSVFPQP